MAEKPHKSKNMKIRSRAGKAANQPIARTGTYSASFEAFLSENCTTFPIQELRKNREKTGGFMRTGLTKREKTTAIYFDEYGSMIEVQTHNTNLKKRLTAFAVKYPECCRQIDDDEQGGLTFEIEKGRLSFRLTAPYSEERKQAASEWAKKNGIGTL
jgi:hypothetical protein